jgi:hypothetical protein
MKIYYISMYESPRVEHLATMRSVPYAHFSALGTWVSQRDPCNACGWHWQDYGEPLLVQWEPSTDAIGDFSWDGPFGYLFLVKEHVAEFLRVNHYKCNFLSVEYVAPEGKGKAKRDPYPNNGPKVMWVVCNSFVDLDMEASAVVVTESCSVCGKLNYTFRNKGIIIRRTNWNGERMLRITTNGSSLATFVSEEGRELIERQRLSNVAFSEAGEIVS